MLSPQILLETQNFRLSTVDSFDEVVYLGSGILSLQCSAIKGLRVCLQPFPSPKFVVISSKERRCRFFPVVYFSPT